MAARSKDKNMALEIGSGKGYHIQDESFTPTIVRSSQRAEADDDFFKSSSASAFLKNISS
jgi:hypothetical protein